MRFKARTKLDTGHPPEPDVENDWGVHEFETEAEREAFLFGISEANNATNGWTEGWLEAEKAD